MCVGSSGVAEQACQSRSARILMTGPACTYTFAHGSALHMSNATLQKMKKQCKTLYVYTSVYNMVLCNMPPRAGVLSSTPWMVQSTHVRGLTTIGATARGHLLW